MKRIIFSTLFSILLLPLFSIMINAAPTSYDAFSCDVNANSFSVDVLSVSNGQVLYNSNACFPENQYSFAITKMNELVTAGNKDVVVRYIKSDVSDFYSPLKIVAASRAMAYTQNETYTLQSTLNIHSLVTLNSAVNYIDNNEPLVYYETNVSNQNSGVFNPNNLVAYIQVNGQSGYVPLKMIDIVPFIYVENIILTPYFIRVTESGSLVVYDRLNREPGILPEPVNYTVANGEIKIYIDRAINGSTLLYSKAPSWLTPGKYYSPNGIHFYTDLDMKNPVLNNGVVGELYSYFLYLNFRSKSNYNGSELNLYLNNLLGTNINTSVMKDQGDVFVNSQNTYGMNALLFYAFAAHESDNGRSEIAVTKLNLFGYGAYDSNTSNAATYTSIQDGVARHMGIQMRFYLDYLNNNRFYSSNLGNKGVGLNTKYASDPYWNVKIAGHAYRIDKALSSKDVNYYQIGILSEDNRNIYTDRSLVTPYLSINSRAKNYPVILNNIKNDIYQIYTSNPIEGGIFVTSSNTNAVPYNFDNSVAYIAKTQVKLVNTPVKPVTIISDIDTLVLSVKRFEWSNSDIYLKGYAALANTNMAPLAVTHKLVAYNLENETLKYEFALNAATPDNNVTLLNQYDYNKAWFDGIIDLSTLPLGHYRFEVETTAGDTSGEVVLSNSLDNAPRTSIKTIDGITYSQRFHNKLKMRYEVSIEKGIEIENRSEYLPSQINSIAFINSISLTEGKLSMNGISFINKASMGDLDGVRHELMIVNSDGVQTKFNLDSGRGNYDISFGGFDYSNAWYFANEIDISTLTDGVYQVYIATYTNQVNDVLRILDHNGTGIREFTYANKIVKLEANSALRNTYFLTIDTIE